MEYFNNIYNRFVAARMLCKIGMLLHTGYRYLRIYNRVSPYGLSQSWYICVLVVGIGSLRIAHILRHPASEQRGMRLYKQLPPRICQRSPVLTYVQIHFCVGELSLPQNRKMLQKSDVIIKGSICSKQFFQKLQKNLYFK